MVKLSGLTTAEELPERDMTTPPTGPGTSEPDFANDALRDAHGPLFDF